MNKFKWIGIAIVLMILSSPIFLLFLPSWSTKLSPALNLMNTLMGPGAEENIQLDPTTPFSFVGGDNESLFLRIDLVLNNTQGGDILFPALNLTFSYGSYHLGEGWVNPEVFIPGGTVGKVQIYAKMQKGDAFNMFMLSLIGGGLNLDISAGEAYLFLDTFGGTQAGVISIPLPSIPLPAMELGTEAPWYPTIHRLSRGIISADTPVEVIANVTDKGGGVKEVILSWTNGTQWENTTMTGLPMKPILGGDKTTLGGLIKATAFPVYPDSPIPTTYPSNFGIVNGTIPAHPLDSNISYRLYLIDDFDYVTVVPATPPNSTIGTPDTIDTINNTYSYRVMGAPIANYTAVWVYGDDGEAGGIEALIESLAASGIDIFGAIMEGSKVLSMLTGNFSTEVIIGLIVSMIEFLEVRGVNPFEIVDQLLGISGGIPEIDTDYPCRANANMTIAMDLLAEGQVSLVDLLTLLEVNMTIVVEALGNAILPPLEEGATISEALFNLLNATRADVGKNASFFTFLGAHDLYYDNLTFSYIYKHNQTDNSWTPLVDQAFDLEGDVDTTYYFGSPLLPGLLGDTPLENFTMMDFDILPNALPSNGSKYQWEYYNGSWTALDIAKDDTNNLTTSGRIFFAPTTEMQPTEPFGGAEELCWIRLQIMDTLTEFVTIQLVNCTVDYVPFYFTKLDVDVLGRSSEAFIAGEMDSFANLLQAMNENNTYAMKIWSLLSYKGIAFEEFIEEVGGNFTTIQGPITENQIITTTSPMLALVVYGVLFMAVVAAARGRKGLYAISSLRVKKWYDSMIQTPSIKAREEMEKLKG